MSDGLARARPTGGIEAMQSAYLVGTTAWNHVRTVLTRAAAAAAALALLAALLGGGAASGAPGATAPPAEALERVAQRIGDAWQPGPRPEEAAPLGLAWTAARAVAAVAGLAWVATVWIVIDSADAA